MQASPRVVHRSQPCFPLHLALAVRQASHAVTGRRSSGFAASRRSEGRQFTIRLSGILVVRDFRFGGMAASQVRGGPELVVSDHLGRERSDTSQPERRRWRHAQVTCRLHLTLWQRRGLDTNSWIKYYNKDNSFHQIDTSDYGTTAGVSFVRALILTYTPWRLQSRQWPLAPKKGPAY